MQKGRGEGSQESGKQLPQRGRTESKWRGAQQIGRVNEQVQQRLAGPCGPGGFSPRRKEAVPAALPISIASLVLLQVVKAPQPLVNGRWRRERTDTP